jgi:hypothetical protein
MTTIQDEIMTEFYVELSKSSVFEVERIEKLKDAFNSGKKLKAADIIEVFAQIEKDVK